MVDLDLDAKIYDTFKKILIIGKTGSGKSSLCNLLFNGNLNYDSMFKPSSVGDSLLVGKTSKTSFYWNIADRMAYVDTIGVGDTRFSQEHIMDEIGRFIRVSYGGAQKVVLVLKHQRYSIEDIVLSAALLNIFTDQNAFIVVMTSCPVDFNFDGWLKSDAEVKEIQQIITGVARGRDRIQKMLIHFVETMRNCDLKFKFNLNPEKDIFDLRFNFNNTNFSKLKNEINNSKRPYYGKVDVRFSEALNAIIEEYYKQEFDPRPYLEKTGISWRHYIGCCPICTNELEFKKYMLSRCNHYICLICLSKVNECPLCKRRFSRSRVSDPLIRSISGYETPPIMSGNHDHVVSNFGVLNIDDDKSETDFR